MNKMIVLFVKKWGLLWFYLLIPVLATEYLESSSPIWMEEWDNVTTIDGYHFEIIRIDKLYIQVHAYGRGIRSLKIDDIIKIQYCSAPVGCSYYIWLTEIYNNKSRLRVATNYEDFKIVNVSEYRTVFPDLPCYPTPYNRSYYEGAGRYSLILGDAILINNLTLVFVGGSEFAKLEVYDYENCEFINSIDVKINRSWSKSFQKFNLIISGYGYSFNDDRVDLVVMNQNLSSWEFWRLVLWVSLIFGTSILSFWIIFRWKNAPEIETPEITIENPGDDDTPFITFLEEKLPVSVELDDDEKKKEEETNENGEEKESLFSKLLSFLDKGKD